MAVNALQEVKRALTATEIRGRFNDILGEKSAHFMASITNAVSGNKALQECDPSSIMAAAFIAASLNLPIDPNLGRSYIIPYNKKAQFQIGYKGFCELALRTGQYKTIHVTEIYEDELVAFNPIENELVFVNDFSKCTQRDAGQTDKIVGYYAKYVMLTGSTMSLYMTKQQVINHAQLYSQAYKNKKKDSPWFTNFDEMAKKTVLKRLLSKYAVLSIDMQTAVIEDQKVYDDYNKGEYRDNMPEESPVDDLAKEVVAQIADNAGQTEKPDNKADIVEQPAAGGQDPMEDDFAAFDESFMNIPDGGVDEELPFR